MKNETKKLLSFFLMMLTIITVINAQNNGTAAGSTGKNVNNIFYTIYTFFTSGYVKVLCLAGLVWIGVKMITNRGDPNQIKALVPWLIAAVVIGSASLICGIFIPNFDTDMKTISSSGGTDLLKNF